MAFLRSGNRRDKGGPGDVRMGVLWDGDGDGDGDGGTARGERISRLTWQTRVTTTTSGKFGQSRARVKCSRNVFPVHEIHRPMELFHRDEFRNRRLAGYRGSARRSPS